MKKTKQLLAHLICNHPAVSITSLMKLSYIIDLVSIQKNNQKISDFEYRRYKYGPFDKKIYTYLNELLNKGIISEDSTYANTGDEFIIYKYNNNQDFSFNEITQSEMDIINGVLETVKGYGAKALTELTYRTKPMKKIGAEIGNEKGLNQIIDLRAK